MKTSRLASVQPQHVGRILPQRRGIRDADPPLTKVAPGQAAVHVEYWSLHRNVRLTDFTDAELDRVLAPLLPAAPQRK
jgi:hypothetical protein